MKNTGHSNLRIDPELYARLRALKAQGEGSIQDNIDAAIFYFLDGTRPGFRAWLRAEVKKSERDVDFLRGFAHEYEKALVERPDEQPPQAKRKK